MSDTDQTAPEADSDKGPLVTDLMPVSEQVGRHVMTALNAPEAVAVLTTIVPGMDRDRVVSVGLSREHLFEVQRLLDEIEQEDEEASNDETKCIGFQCQVDKS